MLRALRHASEQYATVHNPSVHQQGAVHDVYSSFGSASSEGAPLLSRRNSRNESPIARRICVPGGAAALKQRLQWSAHCDDEKWLRLMRTGVSMV